MSRLRQLPRAFGKTLAAGATTGRAREAIFGGETFRVFTSTRGALRSSRGTSSGASAGSGGRRGRVPAFPISSVTSVIFDEIGKLADGLSGGGDGGGASGGDAGGDAASGTNGTAAEGEARR